MNNWFRGNESCDTEISMCDVSNVEHTYSMISLLLNTQSLIGRQPTVFPNIQLIKRARMTAPHDYCGSTQAYPTSLMNGMMIRVNRLITTVEYDKSCGTVTFRGTYVFEGSKLVYGVMFNLEKYWFVEK